jgi:hypothetical protein
MADPLRRLTPRLPTRSLRQLSGTARHQEVQVRSSRLTTTIRKEGSTRPGTHGPTLRHLAYPQLRPYSAARGTLTRKSTDGGTSFQRGLGVKLARTGGTRSDPVGGAKT